MKEDTEVGVLVLKRQKQTVFERSYQTSRFMSTDCQDSRTQLLVIDALFSNCLRASDPVQGEPIRAITAECVALTVTYQVACLSWRCPPMSQKV